MNIQKENEKYEIIGSLVRKAKTGDNTSMVSLLEMFEQLIKKNSYLYGEVDYDLKSELQLTLIKCVKKFSINEVYFLQQFEENIKR